MQLTCNARKVSFDRQGYGIWIQFWPKNRIRGSVPQTMEDLKVYQTNIIGNFESLLFCFHTFGVRLTIDFLDSENQPGSGKIWTGSGDLEITGDVLTPKVRKKKRRL